MVTIGITPTDRPEDWTSFGAIKADRDRLSSGDLAVPIERFEEKPSEDRATEMVAEVGWSWNSGMFVFRLEVAEAALREFQPEMSEIYVSFAEKLARNEREAAAECFSRLPSKIPHPEEPARAVDRHRIVLLRIQEGQGCVDIRESAANQGTGHQRVPSHGT